MYSWECFQSIYPSTVSATLQLFIFCGVPITSVFFSEGLEVQSRNFIHANQLGVSVFPIALCLLCIACCQQQWFTQWTDARKSNYIKFTAMSTEIYYIYKYTRLTNIPHIVRITVRYFRNCSVSLTLSYLFIDFLTYYVIGL